MFKTMDNTEVYDKRDVDSIKDSIDAITSQHTSDINQLKTKTNSLENNSISVNEFNQRMTSKADSSFAQQTRQLADNNHSVITELESRVTNVENNKVNTSDLPQAVNNAVDSIINDKLSLIESDINHIVDNAVDDALESYDDSNTVDSKISTAINNIPSGPTAMTTTEATALVDQYF